MNFITIETPRLILKGLSPADMKNIFENLSKPEIKRVLGHRSEEEYLKEENKQKNGYSTYNRNFKLFLLTDKSSGNIIGRCGIHNWNEQHKRAEVGYIMEDDNYKRKGLMTEAFGAVIDFGFNGLRLNRMEAIVATNNIPSLKLMEKYKFIQEGVLRQHYSSTDTFEDSYIFSKLHQEYLNDVRE